jgi:hypothetical protein
LIEPFQVPSKAFWLDDACALGGWTADSLAAFSRCLDFRLIGCVAAGVASTVDSVTGFGFGGVVKRDDGSGLGKGEGVGLSSKMGAGSRCVMTRSRPQTKQNRPTNFMSI